MSLLLLPLLRRHLALLLLHLVLLLVLVLRFVDGVA